MFNLSQKTEGSDLGRNLLKGSRANSSFYKIKHYTLYAVMLIGLTGCPDLMADIIKNDTPLGWVSQGIGGAIEKGRRNARGEMDTDTKNKTDSIETNKIDLINNAWSKYCKGEISLRRYEQIKDEIMDR